MTCRPSTKKPSPSGERPSDGNPEQPDKGQEHLSAAGFLDFFHRDVGISPAWLCPLRQRDPEAVWTLYELDPGTTYVNVGFWGGVALPGGVDPLSGAVNRLIERTVTELGGRKSLYSTAFYDRDEFDELYNGPAYRTLKHRYDPVARLPGLYEKVVRST